MQVGVVVPRSVGPEDVADGVRIGLQEGAVPIVEVEVGPAAIVRCLAGVIAWQDEGLRADAVDRGALADMVTVHGPGRLALACGQVGLVLPLHLTPGLAIMVRLDQVLLTAGAAELAQQGPGGLGRFEALDGAGFLLLFGRGSVFQIELAGEEHIDVRPEGLLHADAGLALDWVQERIGKEAGTAPTITMVRCSGPGRIAVQSAIATSYAATQPN